MRQFYIKKERLLFIYLLMVILIASVSLTAWEESIETFSMPTNRKVIVIDAGHGGWDPGAVRSGVIEKELNLQIAEKLQSLLEQSGAVVLITRGDDSALADRKTRDLNARREIVDSAQADVFISIHQNSFPDSSVKGLQVFYFGTSERSKLLAESIQEQFNASASDNSRRTAKSNNAYYLLKRTTVPSVIIECGFLSNATDARNLTTEEYQERLAWAIYVGTMNYFLNMNN